PAPAVTMRVWPSGCVCHAERAPGSKVTDAPDTREGSFARNKGSLRTEPVKFWAGPFSDGCDPLRVIAIACGAFDESPASEGAACACAVSDVNASSDAAIKRSLFIF